MLCSDCHGGICLINDHILLKNSLRNNDDEDTNESENESNLIIDIPVDDYSININDVNNTKILNKDTFNESDSSEN